MDFRASLAEQRAAFQKGLGLWGCYWTLFPPHPRGSHFWPQAGPLLALRAMLNNFRIIMALGWVC